MLNPTRTLLLVVIGSSLGLACVDPPLKPIKDEYPPKGVVGGTVSYSGPLPCSEGGHIVGNVFLALYNVNLLPPPDGLGTSAHRVAAVPGDVLFADVARYVPVNPDGSRACPPPGTSVSVSSTWQVGPVDPGMYQIRGFFDYDGDFSAAFKMANMVTKGDVGGGAIANITEVLQGAPVRYQEIVVGDPDGQGGYTIPPRGFVVSNVGVNLAAVIPTNRPYFHIAALQNPEVDGTAPALVEFPGPDQIVVPADIHVTDANSLVIQKHIYTLTLKPGMPGEENAAAERPPFYFHVNDPGKLLLQSYDADHDGLIDENDHITGSKIARAIGPTVAFTKLERDNDPSNLWRVSQNIPRVLSSGITSPGSLLETLGYQKLEPQPVDQFNVIIRPTALCLGDASNPNSPSIIVTPYEKDTKGGPVIGDVPGTISDIAIQLRRNIDNVKVVYQCLPPGYYAINVTYPSSGQTWTLPNESGVCMPGEAPGTSEGKPTCGAREQLTSQFNYLRFGEANDPSYCNGLRKQRNEEDLYRDYCLTPLERERYFQGTLWGGPDNPLP